MSRNRSVPSSECASPSMKLNPHVTMEGPREGLMSGHIKLHQTPVAVAVSVTGERTLCPADAFRMPKSSENCNPFAIKSNEPSSLKSLSEVLIPKMSPRKLRSHIQKRRKFQEKDRRRTGKIILTHRNSARMKQQVEYKCASIQTDPCTVRSNRQQEFIGDAKRPGIECCELCKPQKVEKILAFSNGQYSFTKQGKKKLSRPGHASLHFLPQRLKMLSLYIIMVGLIFWIASILLGVDVPFEFLKIAANYVRSFKWGYYRKEPQTSVEKCLELFAKLFKWF